MSYTIFDNFRFYCFKKLFFFSQQSRVVDQFWHRRRRRNSLGTFRLPPSRLGRRIFRRLERIAQLRKSKTIITYNIFKEKV